LTAEKAIVSGLSGRYAKALFALAQDQKSVETVDTDLDHLKALLSDSTEFAYIVKSPVLSRPQQGKAVAALAGDLALSGLTQNFLGVLAKNRRLNILAATIRDFKSLLASHRGEETAVVTSARPLNKTQVTALTAKLKAMAGRDVAIDAQVDDSLVGGLVVRLGSRMIDGSVATKLDSLERAMKGV
jgi:F-type H+-transporting ATPase subunit delta